MGQRGINPKSWFYGFRDELRERADSVRQVLAGAAAEQWLNAELCAYLARSLPRGLYAYPEYRKRDICVFRADDSSSTDEGDRTAAAIETKLVYPGYSPGKIGAYAGRLAQQMKAVHDDIYREEGGHAPVVGMAFGVWVRWPERFYRRSSQRRPDLGWLRRDGGRSVREGARRFARPAREAFETILNPELVNNGGFEIEVALVGQYLLLR